MIAILMPQGVSIIQHYETDVTAAVAKAASRRRRGHCHQLPLLKMASVAAIMPVVNTVIIVITISNIIIITMISNTIIVISVVISVVVIIVRIIIVTVSISIVERSKIIRIMSVPSSPVYHRDLRQQQQQEHFAEEDKTKSIVCSAILDDHPCLGMQTDYSLASG